jgi:hypothetical protein
MNKVISRGKYSLLTVLSLISVASLMSGAIRAIADEHNPHKQDDMRIVVVADDGNWTDSHTEQTRALIFQNFLAHRGRADKVKEIEEVTRAIFKDEGVRSIVEATLGELSTCPEEARKQLGYQDLAHVGFMPEAVFQSDAAQDVAFTFLPDMNCTDRFCPWQSACQVVDNLKDCIKTNLNTSFYEPIRKACANAKTAIEVVKHSAKLEEPSIGQSLNPATNL